MKINVTQILVLALSIFLTACGGGGGSSQSATTSAASSKTITGFNLAGVPGAINQSNKTITVSLPSGTYVNALVATFTTTGSSVFVGSNSQVSGVNQNDFNNPVTYSVDTPNSPTSSYTVKVTGGVFTSGNAVIKSFDASKCALVSSGNYTSCFANAVGDFSLTAGGCTLSKSNQYLSLQKSGSSTFTGLLDGSTNANIVSDGTSHMAISGGFNLDITTLSISANGMSVNPTTYQVLSTVCP